MEDARADEDKVQEQGGKGNGGDREAVDGKSAQSGEQEEDFSPTVDGIVKGQESHTSSGNDDEGGIIDEQKIHPPESKREIEGGLRYAEDVDLVEEKRDARNSEGPSDDMQMHCSDEGTQSGIRNDVTERGIDLDGAQEVKNEDRLEEASNMGGEEKSSFDGTEKRNEEKTWKKAGNGGDNEKVSETDDWEKKGNTDDAESGIQKDVAEQFRGDSMEDGSKEDRDDLGTNEEREEQGIEDDSSDVMAGSYVDYLKSRVKSTEDGSKEERDDLGTNEEREVQGIKYDSSDVMPGNYVDYLKSRVKQTANDILPSFLGGGGPPASESDPGSSDEVVNLDDEPREEDASSAETETPSAKANQRLSESSPSEQTHLRSEETHVVSQARLDDWRESTARETGGRDLTDRAANFQNSRSEIHVTPPEAESEDEVKADPAESDTSGAGDQTSRKSEFVHVERPQPSMRRRLAARNSDDAPDDFYPSRRSTGGTQYALDSESRNFLYPTLPLDDKNERSQTRHDEVEGVSTSKKWTPLSEAKLELSDIVGESSASSNDIGDARKEELATVSEGVAEGSQTAERNLGRSSNGEDDELRQENAPEEDRHQLLLHPAGLLIRAISFQMGILVHMIATGIWLLNAGFWVMTQPVKMASAAVGNVTNFTSGVVSNAKGGVSQTGPGLAKLSTKTFRGCLSAFCVVVILFFLLAVGMLVDLILINRLVQKPFKVQQALDFDYTQAKPVASFSLYPPAETERLTILPLDKALKSRVIPSGHRFHISAAFMLPESEYNMNLGVFQVSTEVLSAQGRVLMRSSKPCRLRFRSLPARLLRSIVFAVPMALGLTSEIQKLEVLLMDAKEKITPTVSVRIMLEPRASSASGGGIPDVYDAIARLESSLPWASAIVSRWKWTIYVWTGVCLFLFEMSIVLCCCRRIIIPFPESMKEGQEGKENIVVGEVKKDDGLKEMGLSREGKGGRRRVSFEEETPPSKTFA